MNADIVLMVLYVDGYIQIYGKLNKGFMENFYT